MSRLLITGNVGRWLGSPPRACGNRCVSPGNLSSSSVLRPFALGDHFAIALSSSSACAPPFLAHLVFCKLPSSSVFAWGWNWVGPQIAGWSHRWVPRSPGLQIGGSSNRRVLLRLLHLFVLLLFCMVSGSLGYPFVECVSSSSAWCTTCRGSLMPMSRSGSSSVFAWGPILGRPFGRKTNSSSVFAI